MTEGVNCSEGRVVTLRSEYPAEKKDNEYSSMESAVALTTSCNTTLLARGREGMCSAGFLQQAVSCGGLVVSNSQHDFQLRFLDHVIALINCKAEKKAAVCGPITCLRRNAFAK